MEGKPKLGIDIDENVVYTLKYFLAHYNEKHSTAFQENDFKSYRWWETLGITKKQAYAEADEWFRREKTGELCNCGMFDIEFVEGAEQALNLLYFFYDLHGITDRSPLMDGDTHNISSYLYIENGEDGNYFPQYRVAEDEGGGVLLLPNDKIYSTQEEGLAKPALCRKLGIETIVDDNADIARACAREGIRAVVLARSWNARMQKHPLVMRVKDWQEACDLLVPGKHVLPDADRTVYI